MLIFNVKKKLQLEAGPLGGSPPWGDWKAVDDLNAPNLEPNSSPPCNDTNQT